jgi:hypothetical protein
MPRDAIPEPGQPVHVRYTKWGDRPHWEYDQVVLGSDEHGVWTGGAAGTHMSRPGFAFDARSAFVNCFAHSSGWVATFWSDFGMSDAASVYVDITTVPVWSAADPGPAEVVMIDLDLDVIRLFNGHLFVDDEDEFAEHQVSFGYPADVVTDAETTCAQVLTAVQRGDQPFGRYGGQGLEGQGLEGQGVGAQWLRRQIGSPPPGSSAG